MTWASDDPTPPDGSAWDLVVVGGGTAGLVAAQTAAGLGASVLLVERARTGGDCLWTGCVPSKTLLASAHAAADARGAARLGVQVGGIEVDFAAVMARVQAVVRRIEPVDSPGALRRSGVRVVHATARFTAADALALDGAATEVRFRHAVVATGSEPVLPAVPGLADVAPMTSDDVWSLTELPRRLAVLGGGSIGCELAQAFARLGSEVTVLESAGSLLPREDPAASVLVRDALREDGVAVRLATLVEAVRPVPDGGVVLSVADGEPVVADRLLVAVGRRPRTADLGLEAAGVALDDRGHVRVDARLRTTSPRIRAAGDVTGHPAFTHVAASHGSLAASNAVLGLRRRVDLTTLPRVTYTHPEVAAFGASTGTAHRVVELSHDEVDRAVAEGDTRGLTRLALDRRGRIVGATVVGARAGELIGELVVAARAGLGASGLAGVVHPYPAYGDAVWKPAVSEVRERLARPAARWVTGRLVASQRLRSRVADGRDRGRG